MLGAIAVVFLVVGSIGSTASIVSDNSAESAPVKPVAVEQPFDILNQG